MPFDLLGLPQDVRNHIIGYVAQLPAADIARALRVNRELNEHPQLLKALLKTMQKLAKRASYDVMCPECGVDTAERDDLADALCVNAWEERRDDGTTVERSALACRNCLRYNHDMAVNMMDDPSNNWPDAHETDGSRICFMLPKPGGGHTLVPVRELSVVQEHAVVEHQERGLMGMQNGSRDENPGPDWVLY